LQPDPLSEDRPHISWAAGEIDLKKIKKGATAKSGSRRTSSQDQ